MMTRRTRSSSTADNVYTQRSMRSASNNAFFELPHNYGSRKISESSEASPLRRSKRVSTSSSSSNYSFEAGNSLVSPPKRKKLHNNENLVKSSTPEKENLESCNGHAIEEEEEITDKKSNQHNKSNCDVKNCEGSAASGKAKKVLPKIMKNGNCCGDDKLKNPETKKWSKMSHSNVAALSSAYSEQNCDDKALRSCLNKSLLLQKCEMGGFKRKRHFSEDEISSSGRIRRLSERGEMASVMEFFFKNKRPLSNSFVQSRKSKQVTKRVLRKSDLVPSKEMKKSNQTKLKDRLDCDVVIKLKRTRQENETDSSETKSVLTRSFNSRKNMEEIKSKLPQEQEDIQSTEHLAKEADLKDSDIILNGIPNNKVIKELLGHINVAQENKRVFLNQKRSLRSSGIRCQPDYYALSLNLMIRRRRKSITDSTSLDNCPDLQVMSDSEVDLNKKSSIESCFSTNEGDSRPQFVPEKATAPAQTEQIPMQTPGSPDPSEASKSPSEKASTVNYGKSEEKGRPSVASSSLTAKKQDRSLRDFFEPPPLFDDKPPVGPEVYFFESDHVALKHNTDYYSLLHSASVLESQRKQALVDLDVLQQRLKKACHDPIGFVDKLQKKANLDLPRDQVVPHLPPINWSKYTSPFGTFENVFSRGAPSKPFTRGRKSVYSSNPVPQNSSNQPSTSTNASKSRSQTFKKSWSVEEQRKLEELLLKYPQEAVESSRIRKIASELGGRTPLQVQSRVQKYFIKLAKAGLSIPGRMPRLDRMISAKPRSIHRHRSHHQASLTRISTFFSNFHVPVKMKEEDETGPQGEDDEGWGAIKSEQVSDEDDVPDQLRFSDEYLEILQLKRQRKQQLRMFDGNGQQAIARHCGYQCDICQSVPIEGVRYHCIDCPESDSVDLCQSCIRMQTKFETAIHKTNHRMEPVYASVDFGDGNGANNDSASSRPYADADYTKVALSSGEYNYLDPNFLPPSG